MGIISQVFNIIASIRKKEFWKLTDNEKGILESTISGVRKYLKIETYLKHFSIIGFGITLIYAGTSRLLRDIKESRTQADHEGPDTQEYEQITPVTGTEKLKGF